MRRHQTSPRQGWKQKVEKVGLTYHTLADGSPYWDETAYWEFTSAEVDRLEAATADIQELALKAGDRILDGNLLAQMHIPAMAAEQIRQTWQSEPPALYGRLDLAYDGRSIKLLEYNADTPTSLVEAAVAQWYWLEETHGDADQFNSLHEKLVAKWKDVKRYLKQPVYFGHDGAEEDRMTVEYLRDTAGQAGLQTALLAMHEVGWDDGKRQFVDMQDRAIESFFKLYPWEWLLADEFGEHALATMNEMRWIEPIWKMLWSNKALLAVLWEMNPGHELLLPAYLDGPREMTEYVRKPLMGREGAGIGVFSGGRLVEGVAGEGEAAVWQQRAALMEADGNHAVLGSWLIDGEPAGMGVRESAGLITGNGSRFVPHLFR